MRNLRQKLAKTKSGFWGRIAEAVKLRGKVDEELLLEIEDILLRADTGVEITQLVIEQLSQFIRFEKVTGSELVMDKLQSILRDILLVDCHEIPDFFRAVHSQPFIVLFVGVNGVGKTTSIGKVAYRFHQMGKRVMIIAGDTFRAAAIEQLTIWSDRANATIIKSQQGADPSSIIYDGINAALARNCDVVLIDTAGRQHTKNNLMAELEKVNRTIKKLIPDAPHQALLVLDATTGQNAISQATNFNAAIGLTGLILAKFDGTAKGGIIFNLKHNLNLPVKMIGIGESVEDLQEFDPQDFIQAFFSIDPDNGQD